jgi:hypothetical protein
VIAPMWYPRELGLTGRARIQRGRFGRRFFLQVEVNVAQFQVRDIDRVNPRSERTEWRDVSPADLFEKVLRIEPVEAA